MKISRKEYLNRVHGGWFGKCLGGAAGAPVEGRKHNINISDYRSIMNPELPNDDLDIQLLWLDVLEEKGININSNDLAKAWVEKCWYPFSEYGYFLKNYHRGLNPPLTGQFNNPFVDGMGCTIRAEIWGFIFPDNSDSAVRYARYDAQLDHSGNGLAGELFIAAIISKAFAVSDLMKLIHTGLQYVEPDLKVHACITKVLNLYSSGVTDYKILRKEILKDFQHADFTNVTQNVGIIVIALLCGKGDIDRTINIALNCGYDTDCTCATAAAILGTINGFDSITEEQRQLVNDGFVCGIDVDRGEESIEKLAVDTCNVGMSIEAGFEQTAGSELYDIEVNYIDKPSIGLNDSAKICVNIINNSDHDIVGKLYIENLPEDWEADSCYNVNVQAKNVQETVVTIVTPINLKFLHDSNRLIAKFVSDSLQVSKEFYLLGAIPYKVWGPFSDQLEKEEEPNSFSCHGEGCNLPPMECMVNDYVDLAKEYLEEQDCNFLDTTPYDFIINAYEDLVEEEHFLHNTQTCYYLSTKIYNNSNEKLWLVIGNSDGYKIWVNKELVAEKDEMRMWTPYNNSVQVDFKMGENEIVIKLIRRTNLPLFSLGIRNHNNTHWHRQQWKTGLKFSI